MASLAQFQSGQKGRAQVAKPHCKMPDLLHINQPFLIFFSNPSQSNIAAITCNNVVPGCS
jgi:hypothetical protein